VNDGTMNTVDTFYWYRKLVEVL